MIDMQIIKCQEETLQLFYEKQRWPDKCYVLEQTKQKAVADLRKQLSSKSTQTSHLEDLNSALKAEDKLHTLVYIYISSTPNYIQNLL